MIAKIDELRCKINDGSATPSEVGVWKILSVIDDADVTPEHAIQLILQAEAVCNAHDGDYRDALIELFTTGQLEARRGPKGDVELRLTSMGMESAAHLVARIAGKRDH